MFAASEGVLRGDGGLSDSRRSRARFRPVLFRKVLVLAGLCAAVGALAAGQQLEPRAYVPVPVGLNTVGLPFVYQTGSVVTDPSLPVKDVDAKVETLAAFYERTFPFFGRSASALLVMPYAWAKATGQVLEEQRTVTRSGQGDLELRLATNIFGSPALNAQEFARTPIKPALGGSLTVLMPTGQYYDTKLINIGTNRWSFKPELGLSVPVSHWTFEFYAGAWFYTANDDFFGGHLRTQDPLVALQGHVSYNFTPFLWLSIDGTWYAGGQTMTAGVLDDDRQKNSRVGATLALPLGHGHFLKLAGARGATTRFGQNFTTVGLTYQYVWF